MRFFIEELEIFFPYEFIYNEQLEYMKELKQALDQKQHAIIEMPTGTGKTISLLALFVSYLIAYPEKYSKLIYCTRTVAEMEKTLAELKVLIATRETSYQEQTNILALGLTSRRNLCIHPEIQQFKEREKVDSECRKRTAEWLRELTTNKQNLCEYFEDFTEKFENIELSRGIFTLDDLKIYGQQTKLCPYYLARKLLSSANIVVYNYLYFLDQNIFGIVSKEISPNSIIVFDEAHNIDDVCIEAMTVRINKYILDGSINNIEKLKHQVDTIKQDDINKLNEEYQTLLQGLSSKGIIVNSNTDNSIQIPEQIAKEAIPGNIRLQSYYAYIQNTKENQAILQTFQKCLQYTFEISQNQTKFGNTLLKISQKNWKALRTSTREHSVSQIPVFPNSQPPFEQLISSNTKAQQQ